MPRRTYPRAAHKATRDEPAWSSTVILAARESDPKGAADADSFPLEHERRRLRDHPERLASDDGRPGVRLGRKPRHPGVPGELRGGADGPRHVRAGAHQRAVAMAEPERVRPRLGAAARDTRPCGER